jgi:hypothetical protein
VGHDFGGALQEVHAQMPTTTQILNFRNPRKTRDAFATMKAILFASVVLFVALTIGCGAGTANASEVGPQGPPGPQGPQGPAGNGGQSVTNGSRLHALSLVQSGADGSSYSNSFVGWYDTQYSVACSASTLLDGTERCVPTGPSVTVTLTPMPFVGSGGFYADSACTKPLWEQQCDTTATTVVYLFAVVLSESGSGVCTSTAQEEVFALTPWNGSGGYIYNTQYGTCMSYPVPSAHWYTFSALPASAFVVLTDTTSGQ